MSHARSTQSCGSLPPPLLYGGAAREYAGGAGLACCWGCVSLELDWFRTVIPWTVNEPAGGGPAAGRAGAMSTGRLTEGGVCIANKGTGAEKCGSGDVSRGPVWALAAVGGHSYIVPGNGAAGGGVFEM